jgi:hypothetical protein
MKLSTPAYVVMADVPVHQLAGLAGLLSRRGRPGHDADLPLNGRETVVADGTLFKALLEDGGADSADDGGDTPDTDRRARRWDDRTETRGDMAKAVHAHRYAARDAAHAADIFVSDSIDVPAVCGVVTQAWLESRRNGECVVRLALDDDLLPATRLSISERDGRLAVDFVSANAGTRRRLCRGAPALGRRVAGDLARDVLVRVAAHENDRLALEIAVAAPVAAYADAAPSADGSYAAGQSFADSGGGCESAPRPSPDTLAALLSRSRL